MHMMTASLILAIFGLICSFFVVGFIPSVVAFCLGIYLILKEKSIETVRILAIALAGIILPVVMYLNTFGFSLPKGDHPLARIITENYAAFGIDVPFGDLRSEPVAFVAAETSEPEASDPEETAVMYENGKAVGAEDEPSEDAVIGENGIFESLKSIDSGNGDGGDSVQIAPSDDDMPSYGGLPLGTMLVGQYFREDDHNCNPILVLRNQTGKVCRYECVFTARDEDGNELATSEKTVEAVRDGSLFVFEGRFDKRQLNGGIPDAYEFLVSKRDPYEKDMADEVTVYTKLEGSSAILTADNPTDKRIKVDAYVLFFDGAELVDCMWMIPQNTGEVCLDPGTMASIKGNSYYRFDRVETFYTAYEAVGE